MSGPSSTRLLSFRSGGWVLLLAGVLTLGVLAWALAGVLLGSTPVGDGYAAESYGFDLDNSLVPAELLVGGGIRKDTLVALVDPPTMAGADVARLNEETRGKFLVSSDRVIGVALGGEARAYPLSILQVHEVANDVVGGVPIAVTYNPLCDSVVVFDRRVGGETLEFGVSGLLYNSNLLMYDRRADAVGESLWSQLGARAVAGPAAGTPLRVLPAALAAWVDWLNAHPSTSVIERDPRLLKRYKGTKYGQYFRSEKLMFPVAPAPPPDGPAVKQRIVAVEADGVRAAWPISRIAEQADPSGTWRTTVGSRRLRLHVRPETETVIVTAEPADPPIAVYYAFWFAWHAIVERG